MRDIKFRAWDDDGKRMITGHISCGLELNTFFRHTGFVMMQYTGLKDKNGKEIYEGDIIQVYNNLTTTEGHKRWKWYISKVVFEDGMFNLKPDSVGTRDITYDVEIIGTIYENPELIKK